MAPFAFLLLFPAVALRAQITVNGASGTVSTCPNNGSISVSAVTLSPPLLYSIVAGPVTQPVQSNPVFNSLLPGTYSVKLTDGANHDTTLQVTVTGTYTNPDFTTATVMPYCPGDSNGEITGTPTPGTGLGPFTWQLMSPSPVTAPPQAGSHFGNLPAGNYTVRLADACGSYKTTVVTLSNPNTQNPFYGGIIANKVGCDSMHFQFSLQTFDLRLPLTFKYETPTSVHTYTSATVMSVSGGYCHVEQIVPGISYGEPVTVTVYNACGDSTYTWIDINPYQFYPAMAFDSCGSAAVLSFVNDPNNTFDTGLMPPVHYTLTDMVLNTVVDQGSVNVTPPFNIYSTYITGVTTSAVDVGKTYRIDITDGCGETFSDIYTVPGQAPPVIIGRGVSQRACIDSVAGLYYIETAGFTNPRLILTSGPAGLGSSKPGFAYTDTYSYPDTLDALGNFWLMQNLALGTYHFTIIDQCGYQVSDSIEIHPIQVSSLVKELSYKKGCLGQNTIYFGMLEEGRVTVTHLPTNTVVKVKDVYSNNIVYNRDSVTNVPSGQYEVVFEYRQGGYGPPVNDSLHTCWVIRDTIDIEDYQHPEMTTGNAILCNDDINLVLYPDTTKGVPDYHYEIIAGPQTFPEQASNVFTVNQPGNYTARIYDACGNASIKQITVDTLSFDPIQAFTSCNNAVFAFTPSVYFTYHWLMPNGQVHIGDSLILNPVTPADTGMYEISKIININGCVDTLHTEYHVGLGIQVEDTVHFCPGSTVTIGSHTYSLPGTYTDTLVSAAGCDSVVLSHLAHFPQTSDTTQVNLCQGDSIQLAGIYRYTAGFYADSVQNTSGCYDRTVTDLRVHGPVTDTVTASICNGDSYTFGGVSYQTAGIYRDTLVSALGCDSIRVLSLGLHAYTQHAVHQDICPGEYYWFGTDSLTQTGVYTDTLSTAGCDSIVTLTLTVLPYKQYAFSETVCPGQVFVFGGDTLLQSGTYIDTLSTATCDSIVTLTLTALPYKTGTVNQTICAGESYTFGGSLLNQAGTYTDTLTTLTCDSIVTLNLTVLPHKFHAFTDSICEGESVSFGGHTYTLPGIYTDTLSTATCDSIVTLTLAVIPLKQHNVYAGICGHEKYLFNGTYYSQAGVYTYRFPTGGCDSIVTLYLDAWPAPSVSIGAIAYENANGATVQLQANSGSGPLTYLWTSDATLSNTAIANPTANIQEPTWVYLTVTDSNGCTAHAEYKMTVPVTSTLYIPNTYTPNGDPMNPVFRVYGVNIGEFEIMIFNRWGELIFESADMDFGWNGTYMGESVQNGMYVYKVIARGLDNAVYNQIGHITVLR